MTSSSSGEDAGHTPGLPKRCRADQQTSYSSGEDTRQDFTSTCDDIYFFSGHSIFILPQDASPFTFLVLNVRIEDVEQYLNGVHISLHFPNIYRNCLTLQLQLAGPFPFNVIRLHQTNRNTLKMQDKSVSS
jgi:hypothetical protein